MCEIAVIDPERCNITVTQQIAAKFFEEQGDGVGIVAVKRNGDSFEYNTYKSTTPHWQTLYAFLSRNVDDTWRFVVHGRAGTCGGVNREAAHPISVDCDQCEFDYVVHNGSVRNHRNTRAGLIGSGHEFTTEVDSEVLAHKVSELPETVEDHGRKTYSFRGNLNYLLFSEDGILVRVSSKYHLTDDFVMTCSRRSFDEPDELGFERGKSNEWMLITPSGDASTEIPDIETKKRSFSSRGSAYRNTTAQSGNATNGMWPVGQQANDNESTYTKQYTDHCDEFEHVTAIKVAPGVMEIIDTMEGQSQFVHRDADPRLYYWYAPEEVPEDVDLEYLEELAGAEQSNIEDYSDDSDEQSDEEPLEEIAAKAAGNVITKASDEVTMEEAAEIAEDVRRMLEKDDSAIQETIGG